MIRPTFKVRITVDPRPTIRAYNQAERRVLTRAAARIRIFARNSMRRRARPSQPGQPPRVVGGQIKNFIRFAFEPERHVAVVGPMRLPGAHGDTLEALEHGKTTPRRVGRRRRIRKPVRYEPRPAMGPGLEKVSPSLPAMWAGAIR